tara:strand:+ start:12699 stop:12932 length:234 start_codon:yes stop_codon:yes gene_type:complete
MNVGRLAYRRSTLPLPVTSAQRKSARAKAVLDSILVGVEGGMGRRPESVLREASKWPEGEVQMYCYCSEYECDSVRV